MSSPEVDIYVLTALKLTVLCPPQKLILMTCAVRLKWDSIMSSPEFDINVFSDSNVTVLCPQRRCTHHVLVGCHVKIFSPHKCFTLNK
jgi:hypothetical protein